MRFLRTGRKPQSVFDMTPMIDVVLQLIIFFMYTSQFAHMARTPVDMPEQPGDEQGLPVRETITVDLAADGTIVLEGEAMTLEQLARVVEAEVRRSGESERVGILIRADRNLDAAHLNALAERLGDIGVRGWKLGTNTPGGGA